jgi:hypothetical protein
MICTPGHHRRAPDCQLPPPQDGGQPLPRTQQLPERKPGAQTEGQTSGESFLYFKNMSNLWPINIS